MRSPFCALAGAVLFLPPFAPLASSNGPFTAKELEEAGRRLRFRQAAAELYFAFRFDNMPVVPVWLSRLRKAAPGSATWRFFRAARLERKGRRSRAMREIRRALELDPSHHHAWMLRGWMESRAGRHAAAAKSFARALRLAPYDPYAAHGLARSLVFAPNADGSACLPDAKTKKRATAADCARRALELNPGNFRAAALLAGVPRRPPPLPPPHNPAGLR